ncbi:MAG: GntR family transcriptional regulator [Verrucomicrobia bacterium]|nr:GntR family transcriptional regulator [Verrucomicrobiota bacterium]
MSPTMKRSFDWRVMQSSRMRQIGARSKEVLRKVAQDLGISLTPVRDAINRLIAENVLDRGGEKRGICGWCWVGRGDREEQGKGRPGS